MSGRIYLDYAAATQLSPSVEKAMVPFWRQNFANPSALTTSALAASAAITAARQTVAHSIGAKPHQIIFTSGATEANNLAIRGVMGFYPDKKILISAIEHESVLEPAGDFKHAVIKVNSKGELDLDDLERKLTDDVVLISVIHASNEIGTIQPLRDMAALLNKIRGQRLKKGIKLPLLLHTDAAQSPQVLDLHVHRLDVDFMTLSAAKIYGPKGIGCLFVKDRTALQPQLTGGGQEFGLRSGTEPVPLIVGFGQAVRDALTKKSKTIQHFEELRTFLTASLAHEQPDIRVNADSKHRLPQIISLYVPGADGEALVMALDQQGIEAATGSACAASTDEPSHVLSALGLGKKAASSLRLSFGRETTRIELQRFIEVLGEVRTKLK